MESVMAERDNPSGAPTLAQSAIVELGFGLLGLVLIVVHGRSVPDSFTLPVDAWIAVSLGLVVGRPARRRLRPGCDASGVRGAWKALSEPLHLVPPDGCQLRPAGRRGGTR
jgi:hypothetical protein